MSPFGSWCKRRCLSVRLTVHGDHLRYKSPESAVKAVPPLLAENRTAAAACVADSSCYPITDGPFMPWCVSMSPGRTAALLDDLEATVSRVIDIEGWPAGCLTHPLDLVARQSVSTLTNGLAHFHRRFDTVVMPSKMSPLHLT